MARPGMCGARDPRAAGCRRSRPGAESSWGSSWDAWARSRLWDSYGYRSLPGRFRRAPQNGFGKQRARRLGRDERRLDVERVGLQMRLPPPKPDAGLDEPLEHADIVGGPDVARRAKDDRARESLAPPEELAIRGPVGLDARRGLGLGVVPGAERSHVEMADLDDVDDEAAAIRHGLAGHVGPNDAAVLLCGRLDRVHRVLARDQIATLRHVAGG